jgi:predicted RNase H-like HicB family nuclease
VICYNRRGKQRATATAFANRLAGKPVGQADEGGIAMLKYHAAFYREDDGWYIVSLLDFPGVNTQGKNLREARHMIRDALQLMAECYLEEGKALPKPKPKASDKEAAFHETVGLEVRARVLARS